MASEDGDIVWSDDTMTIRDVVYTSMPAIVRVAEGYLGSNEAESFSRGDLLKLDFVKSVQKIYATVISSWTDAILEDRSGYMQPDHEIIIPLLYKGKVLIARPPNDFKVYHTVPELLRDFPRYVRVETEFFAQSNQDKTMRVEVGKRLELDRYLPNQGLVAKYEGGNVVLSQNMRGRFVPLPDDTQYTLKEVVDTLPLPQYVRFVEDEFQKVLTTDLQSAIDNVQAFTGCVKLTRVFREEVVVGHHKPQLDQVSESMRVEMEKYVQRSIVLLPLGREAVNEIEVNVPIYSEPDEYELLAVRNFSQNSPSMDVVEGSLYLEFSKNPRSFYMIDDKDEDDDEVMSSSCPPPIPPRPGTDKKDRENKPPKRPPRQIIINEVDEDYEPVEEPKQVETTRRPAKHKKKDYQNATVKPKVELPVEKLRDEKETFDGPLLIYEVPDNINDEYIALPQKAHKIAVPGQFYKTLKRVQSELLLRFKPKAQITKPVAVSQPLPSSPVSKTPVDHLAPPFVPQRIKPPSSPDAHDSKEKFKPPPSPNALDSKEKFKPSPATRILKEQPNDHPSVENRSFDTNTKTAKQPPRPKPKTKADQKFSSTEQKKTMQTKPIKRVESDDDDVEDYDYPDVSKMSFPSQPQPQSQPQGLQQPRPIGKVQPSTRNVPTTHEPRLSQMSVKELVSCLRQCALSKLADLCDEHKMDGQFIADIEENDLNKSPFNLNLIEMAKLKKMKKGWRPRIE